MKKTKKIAKKVLIINKDVIETNEKFLELVGAFVAPIEYRWQEFNGKWMIHRCINENIPVLDNWGTKLKNLCGDNGWDYRVAKKIFTEMVTKFNNDEVARLTLSPPEAEAKRFKLN